MRLAINAIMTRPGGALTVLVGLLKAWRTLGCDFDITLLVGVPATIETIKRAKLDCRLEESPCGGTAWRRAWWQQARLGRWLRRNKIEALLTNNHYLPRLPCPQVVH